MLVLQVLCEAVVVSAHLAAAQAPDLTCRQLQLLSRASGKGLKYSAVPCSQPAEKQEREV